MKKVLLVLLAAVVSNLYSQPVEMREPSPRPARLVRLDYDNSSGEKGATFFDHGENGLIERALWELESGERYSLNVYAYDERGRLIEKAREYSDHKDTVQLYRYDDRNRLVAEEFLQGDISKGVTTYEYDARDRIALIRCHAYNGWIEGTITIRYDDKGLRTGAELIQEGKAAARIAYEYDDTGDLTSETWEFASGWEQTFRYRYDMKAGTSGVVYASPNPFVVNGTEPVRREDYTYGDKVGGPSSYRYGESGKLLEKTYERSDGLTTRTFYLFGTDGLLLRALRSCSDNTSALFRFRYDTDRRMTSKEFFASDGSHGKDVFTYDPSGALSEAEFVNSDRWLNGTMAIVESKRSLPSRGVYKDKAGFGAGVSFEYDQRSLLTRIVWRFSDGTEQIYRYSY